MKEGRGEIMRAEQTEERADGPFEEINSEKRKQSRAEQKQTEGRAAGRAGSRKKAKSRK